MKNLFLCVLVGGFALFQRLPVYGFNYLGPKWGMSVVNCNEGLRGGHSSAQVQEFHLSLSLS